MATKCPIDSDDNLRTFASNMYVKSWPKKSKDEQKVIGKLRAEAEADGD